MRFLASDQPTTPKRRADIDTLLAEGAVRPGGMPGEHDVYRLLELAGMATPPWYFHPSGESDEALSSRLPHSGPFVAKAVLSKTSHKIEHKALAFNITSDNAADAAGRFRSRFGSSKEFLGVLFAEQIRHDPSLGNEILLGLYQDPFFGPCVALGLGGTRTEYFKSIMPPNKSTLMLPAAVDLDSVEHILRTLPIVELMEGKVRGMPQRLSCAEILSAVKIFQQLGRFYSPANHDAPFVIEELEVNPAVALDHKVVALDGVLRVRLNDRPLPGTKPLEKIEKLLTPKSVAIAGASGKDPANPANIILKKFIKAGVSRDRLYCIHPTEGKIEGVKCAADIPTLMELRNSEPMDCLIVGAPAKASAPLIADAFDHYAAHALQIISAGFGETEAGKSIQHDLTQRLLNLNHTPKRRPVVNGPNTLGNVYRGIDTLFTPAYKSSGTGKGRMNAAFICQSGAFMITQVSDLADVIAPGITISVGNQMDLSVADFLEYLLGEEGITTYGLYIEGLNPTDGLRLMQLTEAARERGRFVVLYKAGRTEAGMAAAKSHTAAMAGDYHMFVHLMSRAGAIVADNFQEFENLMLLTTYCQGLDALMKLPEGKLGVAALSNAGYEKCVLADHLMAGEPQAFELATFTKDTRDRLEAIFIDHGIAEIVDVHDVLDLSPMMNDEGYEKIIRTVLSDPNVDMGIFSIVPQTAMLNTCEPGKGHKEDMLKAGSILNRLIHIHHEMKKPFVVSMESGWKYERFRRELLDAGVPVFRHADNAARAVAQCLEAIRQ